jgi:hypothetical protein
MGIRIKFEGQGNWTLRNEGQFDGNKTFYFLEALRKEGFSFRLSTGEGPMGTRSAVKTGQLEVLRQRMASASVSEVRA